MTPRKTLLLALLLILTGDVLAWAVQTGGGRIEVRDVRWTGSGGTVMSGLVYVPPGATPETPAPGILAVHGYINTRETQSGFAIELARRGFVVLAMDQTGHGYSEPPAFAHGFGGPDGLAYLRSLPFVDGDNIGLEGHSMGGWAVLIAAAGAPDAYRSVVLEGSSTGTSGAPDATREYPRNLAVVFSKFDEFSGMMWGSPVAGRVPESEKLKAAFGTAGPVEVGRVYGSVEEGTARVLYQPPVTHPGDHLSRRAIGHAVDWFQRTLQGAEAHQEAGRLPPKDQVWYWKEAGTLLALVGMVLLLFPLGRLLLNTAFFSEMAGGPPVTKGATGPGWWLAALVFAALPATTLFPLKELGSLVTASALFPQAITTQIMAWALGVGLVSAVLFFLWHIVVGRKAGATLEDYGLTREGAFFWRRLGKSLLLAFLLVASAYLTLVLSARLFTVDYRIWVFAVKPLSPLHLRISLSYLIPFTGFFLVYGVVLFGQLRRDLGLGREMLLAAALSTVGFLGLLAYQYTPLLLGGTLAIPSEALWSIIAFQFVPLLGIVGLLTAYFHRATGQVYVGGFLCGMLVTWIVVASQATHVGL